MGAGIYPAFERIVLVFLVNAGGMDGAVNAYYALLQRAGGDHRLAFGHAAVGHRHVIARPDKIDGHGLAHNSHSDKSDFHSVTHLSFLSFDLVLVILFLLGLFIPMEYMVYVYCIVYLVVKKLKTIISNILLLSIIKTLMILFHHLF